MLFHLIIHSIHSDPACCAMWLHVEHCPREQWVTNDRARVATVCLWLTQFDLSLLGYHGEWAGSFPLGDWVKPWGSEMVCKLGTSEQTCEEEGPDWRFRWVQLHARERGALVSPFLTDKRGQLLFPPPTLYHAAGGHVQSTVSPNEQVSRKLAKLVVWAPRLVAHKAVKWANRNLSCVQQCYKHALDL